MAIKGLTDRGLAFPEIGSIRKGAKKESDRPGRDLEYFRVEFDVNETEAAVKFHSLYGDKPVEIGIVLPFNEIERMWDPFLEAYVSGRMIARSDGERILYLNKGGRVLVKNGIDVTTGQPMPYVEGEPIAYWINRNKGNKQEPVFLEPVGRLKVIIPALERAAYLTLHTTSIHDIVNISDQLRALSTLNHGQIAGIPMVLRRRPKMISTPKAEGSFERVRRSKWMCSIEADPAWVQAMLSVLDRAALPAGSTAALLPSSAPADPEPEPEDDFDEGEYFDEGPEDEFNWIPEEDEAEVE